MTGTYIGERCELAGYSAELIAEQRGLAPGKVMAQFTRVPAKLGDPSCLQSGGAEPLPGDLRFGWHEFDHSDFIPDVD